MRPCPGVVCRDPLLFVVGVLEHYGFWNRPAVEPPPSGAEHPVHPALRALRLPV